MHTPATGISAATGLRPDISVLPDDLLMTVFSCLPAKNVLLNIPLVCKQWKSVSDDSHLWRMLVSVSCPEFVFHEDARGFYRNLLKESERQTRILAEARARDEERRRRFLLFFPFSFAFNFVLPPRREAATSLRRNLFRFLPVAPFSVIFCLGISSVLCCTLLRPKEQSPLWRCCLLMASCGAFHCVLPALSRCIRGYPSARSMHLLLYPLCCGRWALALVRTSESSTASTTAWAGLDRDRYVCAAVYPVRSTCFCCSHDLCFCFVDVVVVLRTRIIGLIREPSMEGRLLLVCGGLLAASFMAFIGLAAQKLDGARSGP